MNSDNSGCRREPGRQDALSPEVRILIEAHLRNLARVNRPLLIVSSRDDLARHYRVRGKLAAALLVAGGPDFSLTPTPTGSVVLTRKGGTEQIVWTRSELLQEQPGATNEVESRAIELAGGLERFQMLTDDGREAITAQAAQELIRELRGS